jgi:phosphoserine phosphatase
MHLKPFPPDKLIQIKRAIDAALTAGAKPIAAFDADGTLWNTDLGENFFDYQIRNRLLPSLPQNAWEHYRFMHDQNPEESFLWLAKINAGIPLETIRGWARDAVEGMPVLPIFEGMKDVINYLQKVNVDIYVVTASIKWAVEPGAERLGIPAHRVLGVETAISRGIVTEQPQGVVTWREGKVTGLLDATKKESPFLSAGNTMGDLALLDAASHIRLVNVAAPHGDRNFESERKLLELAQKRGWFHHEHK